MPAGVTPDSAGLPSGCFAFGDLPAISFQDLGGTFRPIGLAALLSARRHLRRAGGWRRPVGGRGRGEARTPPGCLLPEVAHAHVHTIALDLAPMEHPTTQLNWPAELKALAEEPNSAAAVAGLQARLRDCERHAWPGELGRRSGPDDSRLSSRDEARPLVDTRLIRSHGLVWRSGSHVPVSGTYEHIQTTLPLVDLLRTRRDVAAAFGRCLADPERYQNSFLLTCVQQAGLAEQMAMLAGVPQEEQSDALDALYGHVHLDKGQAVIIALPAA
jgi:hypothetical protein